MVERAGEGEELSQKVERSRKEGVWVELDHRY